MIIATLNIRVVFYMKKRFNKKENSKINYINYVLAKRNIVELNNLLGNTKSLFLRNFISGISRGMGIGIGVTIITAFVIYILQKIVRLNIPLIGQYLSDILEIVGKNNNSQLY